MSTYRTFVGGVQVTAVSDGDLFLEKSFYPGISEAQNGLSTAAKFSLMGACL